MPLGNLTSQFFANVYLNELDYFVKHELKAEYYIRYVDDFIILHNSKEKLEAYKEKIDTFLGEKLDIQLHPDKSKIFEIKRGTTFLGFKVFYYYRLLKKTNIRRFRGRLSELCLDFANGNVDYDIVYDFMEGWTAYSSHANTHNLKKRVLGFIDGKFEGEVSTKECNRYLKICNN